jgi:tRNA A-37 threonylcarbamoyl transferase component Bud32
LQQGFASHSRWLLQYLGLTPGEAEKMSNDRIHWIINKEYESLFTPDILDAIVSRKLISKASTVRELENRKVLRLTLSQETLPDVYLKAHSLSSPKIIKTFLPARALVEWRVALELVRRKIPTYIPIAFGSNKRWGIQKKSYLFTKAIPNSKNLKTFMDEYTVKGQAIPWQHGREICRDLAAFMRKIHQAGILPQDLHWGNILIQSNIGYPWAYYLIDLHKVKIKSSLTFDERLKNLALLSVSFFGKVPDRSLIRFLWYYSKECPCPQEDFYTMKDRIQGETWELLQMLWRKREQRCVRENKYFGRIKMNGRKGFRLKDYGIKYLDALMRNPDILFFDQRARITKDSRTSSSLLYPLDGWYRGVYLKRFNCKGRIYSLKYTYRRSRAKKAWQAANSFMARGVPTPKPILYFENRFCRLLYRSYFVTEMIPDAVSLQSHVEENFAAMPLTTKRAMLRALARHIKKMHVCGLYHGDLKANNILIQIPSQDETKIFFVDLDAVRIKHELSPEEKTRDLGRLNCSFLNTVVVSRTQRLYFLQCYSGKRGKKELRRNWNAIYNWTGIKLQKSKRNFV